MSIFARVISIVQPRTLKTSLAISLTTVVLTPIVLIGIMSYYWIYRVQVERIDSDLQQTSDNEMLKLQNTLDDLSRASQLLANDGGLGEDVLSYLNSYDMYQKTKLFQSVSKSIDNIYFSSPSIGLLYYYLPKDKTTVYFANEPTRHTFDIDELPVFLKANRLTYYGVYKTAIASGNHDVLSLRREIKDDQQNIILYVYLETKKGLLEEIFSKEKFGLKVEHVLENPYGEIVYSQIPVDFSLHSIDGTSKKAADYKTFYTKNRQGWKLHLLVPKQEYMREMGRWRVLFLQFSLLSIGITTIIFRFVWKMLYNPLRRINQEISQFGLHSVRSKQYHFKMKEFLAIQQNFHEMRTRIMDLLTEVELKEKRKGELEVEKLLVQINPHFIQNTLNTIQWIARMNHQSEIARLVAVFTNVLHYNLGKQSIIVTVAEELEALRDYVELQSIRYDFRFEVEYAVDKELARASIPRFILQPIVENALYHGLNHENGALKVTIAPHEGGRIMLSVQDNGQGMTADRLNKLLDEKLDSRKSGLGIGLRYVYKMIDHYYGGRGKIDIQSEDGKGTTITLLLPRDVEREVGTE